MLVRFIKIAVYLITYLLIGGLSIRNVCAQQNVQPANALKTLPSLPSTAYSGGLNQQRPSQLDEFKKLEQLAELQRKNEIEPQKTELPSVDIGAEEEEGADSPDQQTVQSEAMREQAFQDMLQQIQPLTPEQILKLRDAYENNIQAVSSTAKTPPRPTATSQFVDLSPGSTPPVIRLAEGFVTSMVFLDSTGAPWPIESYNIGNPRAFNLQWNRKDNTIMVQAKTLYTYGNLGVRLKGLNTPVMITLIPGQNAVDYRVDLRIQGYGPNAKYIPSGDNFSVKENQLLLSVLDGIPPTGSVPLKAEGGEVEAWLAGNSLYVRTRHKILSPGWISSLKSADGMRAYEMIPTPRLLISNMGKIVTISLK